MKSIMWGNNKRAAMSSPVIAVQVTNRSCYRQPGIIHTSCRVKPGTSKGSASSGTIAVGLKSKIEKIEMLTNN